MSGHAHTHGTGERQLFWAAALTGGFMLAEVIGGVISGSLALIADAAHMLTDFASLALAWWGMRLACRPADPRRTYGWDRFTVLVAFANGLALFAIAGWIMTEAGFRLADPAPVLAGTMLTVAVLGLFVNVAAFLVLHPVSDRTLNLRAATLHVVGDLLGSVSAIGAALVIMGTGWTPIDPLLSVLVALIILRSAWGVVRESGHILLEGAPPGTDTRSLAADLEDAVPGVTGVRHVHAWSISETRPMVTLEARIARDRDPEAAVQDIKARLAERHGIAHATVEATRDPSGPRERA